MTTRELAGDGGTLLGRGYQLIADDGSVVERAALRPAERAGAADRDPAGPAGGDHVEGGLAVVAVEPATVEQRQALAFPAFGVDRPVTLRPGEEGVAVLDGDGRRQAGWVAAADAPAVAARLACDEGLATWVCWEWLGESGRTGIEVALSSPELAPRPLGPPATGDGDGRATADRRVWLAAAAVLVLIAVGLATCG